MSPESKAQQEREAFHSAVVSLASALAKELPIKTFVEFLSRFLNKIKIKC